MKTELPVRTPLVWLTVFVVLLCPAFIPTASGQTVDSWSDNTRGTGFKRETAAEWSLGTPPSLAQSQVLITNRFGNGVFARTVNIDATTAGSFPGTMTISNLTLSSPSVSLNNTVFLNNTGSMALDILQIMIVSNGGRLVVTNSTVIFSNRGFHTNSMSIDGSVLLEAGTLTVQPNPFGFDGDFGVIVGQNSTGMLVVAGTFDVVENSGIAVGYNPGSTGVVVITGGEFEINGDDYLGDSGVGSLVQSGGVSAMAGEFIAVNPGSQGTLTVAGGTHGVGIDGLSIGRGSGTTGTVWVTGGDLDVFADAFIGESGVGSLIQSNGSVSLGGELVGEGPGMEGLLAISDGTNTVGSDGLGVYYGAIWLVGGVLQVTNQSIFVAVGSLTQSNGALEASAEYVGGLGGNATLTMAGGTHVVGFGGLGVGNSAGSTGSVWVAGGHLLATSFSNVIGGEGIGSLVQSNGDMEMIFSEYVGDSMGGEGMLTVAGGTHTVEGGELIVGNSAISTGSVWVTGGQLSTDSAVIGLAGVGQMAVSNGNWQVEDVSVGAASGGNGTLTVAGGTSVVSSDLTIGTPDCTGTGTVTVTGGVLFVTNAAHNAVLDLENSTLTLRGGTLVADILIKTNPCASFTQTGGTLIVSGITNIFTPLPFSITVINREGNNIRITWQTPGGVTNVVQATNGGPSGIYNTNFVNLSPQFIIVGNGLMTTNYLDIGSATNTPSRFYRVRLVP